MDKETSVISEVFAPITKPVRKAVSLGMEIGKKAGISYAKEYGLWLIKKRRTEEVKIDPTDKGEHG